MSSRQYQPKRVRPREKKKRRPPVLPLVLAAAAVCLGLLIIPSLGRTPAATADTPAPPASTAPVEEVVPTPPPPPGPPPPPAPPPGGGGLSQPLPASEPVGMEYFADALFIGDSRTDGLQLYSGVEGADFYSYRGLTVFETAERKVIDLNGGKYSVVEALQAGPQYAKIYISLGVNELGYFDDQAFHDTFATFLRQVRQAQPDAVIYLENLVPVNPDKCAANDQPYYVNNDRVAAYNAIYPKLAEEEHVVFLDVAAALSDENGILPASATVDGVHFTKEYYKTWLAFLMEHTVDPEVYHASVAAAEGAQ